MTRRWFRPTCLLLVIALGGCGTTVIPPRAPADPVSIYLTDYGRHSSVLLPDPRGHLTEYAFGDWNWFALRHTDSGDGVNALFFSRYATLGRRQLSVDDWDDVDHIARATLAAHVARIEASRQSVDALLQRLDRFYDAHVDTVTYSPASSLWFVRYRGNYSVFHNCNHATAGWLRELGCDVRGSAMFSKFTVRPPDAPAPTPSATQSARAGAKLENRPTYGPAGG